MGQKSWPDLVLPIESFAKALDMLESDLHTGKSRGDLPAVRCIVHIGSAITQGLEGSYRGNELFLTDLYGLRRYIDKGRFN